MLALYRKYRPAVFGDVIAQEQTTRTLVNQVKSGRITHAYLFTGSRGTGKTTCARIFARAVNCLSPENGSPCHKCEVCKALDGGNVDIIELDAASNNGVDQIRDLIDNVQYPPVVGKYKVYIIDEAHMLTPSAFNALLKTLEEPPAHAIFILATTEVHKLPATVLSRCMRFDFRLVPQSVLKARLKEVYELEGVTATDDALALIASAAEGSWRDLLSLADRCMNYSASLTADDVVAVLGSAGRQSTRELFGHITACRIPEALSAVERICSEGKSVGLVARDLAAFARDLLLIKTSVNVPMMISSDEAETMRAEAEAYSVNELATVITVFSSIDAELRYSVSPRIVLECAVFKAAKLATADLTSIEERLARLERLAAAGALPTGTTAQTAALAQTAPSAPAPETAATAVSAQTPGTADPADTDKRPQNLPMDARSVWGRILTHFRTKESTQLFALLGGVTDVAVKGDRLVITADGSTYLRLTEQDVTEALGRAMAEESRPLVPEITKNSAGVDMDEEISLIKKMIGDAKLNVKN